MKNKICGFHCVKSVRIRSFSGQYFPAFGMNTERYGVSPHIQSKCGKIQTRQTPNTDTFHAVFVWLAAFIFFVTLVDLHFLACKRYRIDDIEFPNNTLQGYTEYSLNRNSWKIKYCQFNKNVVRAVYNYIFNCVVSDVWCLNLGSIKLK